MKIFFRILSYSRSPFAYFIPYFVFNTLSTFFNIVNFGMLIPLLDTLFGSYSRADMEKLAVLPEYSFSASYVSDLFYYYLANLVLDAGKLGALQFICFALIASVLLTNVFKYLASMTKELMKAKVVMRVRSDIFRKISRLHLGYFSNQKRGDLMSRTIADVTELENTVTQSLQFMFREPIMIIGYFAFLFFLSWKMTLFSLIMFPISGIVISRVAKKLKRKSKRSQESISNITSILDETLGAVRIIKAFNASAYTRSKFEQENKTYMRSIFSIAKTRELASPISDTLGVVVITIILLYGGNLIFQNNSNFDASAFVAYIAIFSQVLHPFKAMANSYSSIQRGLVAGERVFDVIDTPIVIRDKPSAKPFTSFEHSIEFRNVHFRYKNQWILRDISFTIEKGQTVALVGETGSGKSTIADLIPRFYDVQKGKILIDGFDISDWQLESLRQQMGVVTQDSILFNDTIYNNIAFANEHTSLEQVEQAAKIANAHDFIMEKEKQYQTLIGDRGALLSGGQQQRVTIARAVLKNPPILILDEATSALDTESEKLVQEALNTLMNNRTSLVIAHRLSTIQNADKILVLKKGKIVEMGNHDSLLQEANGYYKKLTEMQAG